MKPEGMTNQEYHRNFLYLKILEDCLPEDEVLEIGCGDGTGEGGILGPPMIADKVYDYVGIDKKSYVNPPTNMNFVQADIEQYPVSGLYDKIIALYVVQYTDPEYLFRLAPYHLKPGGRAYFSEGLQWVKDGPVLKAAEICEKFRESLTIFNQFKLFGIEDGIIVPEEQAETGVFVIASN